MRCGVAKPCADCVCVVCRRRERLSIILLSLAPRWVLPASNSALCANLQCWHLLSRPSLPVEHTKSTPHSCRAPTSFALARLLDPLLLRARAWHERRVPAMIAHTCARTRFLRAHVRGAQARICTTSRGSARAHAAATLMCGWPQKALHHACAMPGHHALVFILLAAAAVVAQSPWAAVRDTRGAANVRGHKRVHWITALPHPRARFARGQGCRGLSHAACTFSFSQLSFDFFHPLSLFLSLSVVLWDCRVPDGAGRGEMLGPQA